MVCWASVALMPSNATGCSIDALFRLIGLRETGRCPSRALQAIQGNIRRALELWVNQRPGPVDSEGNWGLVCET